MVEHSNKSQFGESGEVVLTLPDVIGKARMSVSAITSAPLDAVRSCCLGSDDQWIATVEVIESHARLGDNDLLSAYALTIDPSGNLVSFERVGRYYREERESA